MRPACTSRPTTEPSPRRPWPVIVLGCGGLLLGSLVGLGMTEGYTHARWPTAAGFVLGVVGALAAPARRVLVAGCGGGLAALAAVVTIVCLRYAGGHWPLTDEVAIAQYGTAAQATLRAAAGLGVLIGTPCLLAAVLVTAIQRRLRAAAWSPTPR